MKNMFIGIISFALGAACGMIVSKRLYEESFNVQLTEEFNRLRDERLKERRNEKSRKDNAFIKEKDAEMEIVKKYSENNDEKTSVCVISPDEVGDNDDYETISLTYYHEDGVLADQTKALCETFALQTYIDVAYCTFSLDGNSVSYWIGLVIEVRNLIRAWRKANDNEFRKTFSE